MLFPVGPMEPVKGRMPPILTGHCGVCAAAGVAVAASAATRPAASMMMVLIRVPPTGVFAGEPTRSLDMARDHRLLTQEPARPEQERRDQEEPDQDALDG